VTDSWCKFFFKGKNLTDIFCGAKADESGRRTIVVVTFKAHDQDNG
jgi:hypothetical protein